MEEKIEIIFISFILKRFLSGSIATVNYIKESRSPFMVMYQYSTNSEKNIKSYG